MKEQRAENVIRLRILELEDKLMYVVELSNKYEDISVPFFEFIMNFEF